jgi:predicted RNase H-like HicB family nuclease
MGNLIMRFRAVFWKEEEMYIIKEVFTGVTTQGKSLEEAADNLKEAMALYLEEKPEIAKELSGIELLGEIDVKTPEAFGA